VIEEFDFTPVHRPGSRHGNADAMSRLSCTKPKCCGNTTSEYEIRGVTKGGDGLQLQPGDGMNISREQDRDQELNDVKQMLKADTEPPPFDVIACKSAMVKLLLRQFYRLAIQNNTLVRSFGTPSSGQVTMQVVFPRRLRRPFIQEVHQNIGHLGLSRTKAAVQ
jgi:hypothetical protein